jgi:ectoine hydroxylase-related dioxygenase (phytanoyl-CoA dioxygenase family)
VSAQERLASRRSPTPTRVSEPHNTVADGTTVAGTARLLTVREAHKHFPFFADLTRHAPITAILQDLLGPNIRLHGTKLNMKLAGFGAAVEWHQDWAFYPHTNDDLLATGIYLDDCEMENGPLLVLPGSHKGPVYDHHTDGYFSGAMDFGRTGVAYDKAVPLTGRAGSMTIHHVRLVHGSALNTSSKPRRLLLHEYAAADAWPIMGVADFSDFNSRIVLGKATIELRECPRRAFPWFESYQAASASM